MPFVLFEQPQHWQFPVACWLVSLAVARITGSLRQSAESAGVIGCDSTSHVAVGGPRLVCSASACTTSQVNAATCVLHAVIACDPPVNARAAVVGIGIASHPD